MNCFGAPAPPSSPTAEGGQVMVLLVGRKTFVPTGSRELRPGTLHVILRDLALSLDDLRRR